MKRERTVRGKKDKLKPYGPVIQICPICNKVDVYKNDGHSCSAELNRQENMEYYD